MSERIAVPGGYRFPEKEGVYGEWTFLPITIAVEEMQLIRKLYELPPLSREELTKLFERASRHGLISFITYETVNERRVVFVGRVPFLERHLDFPDFYIPVGLKSEAKYILVHESCNAPFVEPKITTPHPTAHGDITHLDRRT